MIKAIVFDFGGVVVSNEIRKYVLTHAADYFKVSAETMETALRKNEHKMDLPGWSEGKYWQGIALGLAKPMPSKKLRFWVEKYKEVSPVNTGVVDIISRLRSNGYKLAVLSNTVQEHFDINKKRGLYNFFDVKVFSCDPKVNSKKPGRKIYDYCLKQLGLLPGQCVFIDDNKEYLSPAKELGMKTILFRNAGQLKEELISFGVKLV